MKNLYIIIILLISTIAQAQIVDIPDANFKNALVNENVVDTDGDGSADSPVDLNGDGEIQVSEAEVVTILKLPWNYGIVSLEGIQSFINLEYLKCTDNDINSLDLTQNINLTRLYCNYNNLDALDLSLNTNLLRLFCGNNNLTELDVTQNTLLDEFSCIHNNISTLDLTQNLSLYFIDCGDNNITSLDLSTNSNLDGIFCYDNPLVDLNIKNGNNTNISQLHAYGTPFLCIQVDDVNYANNQICDMTDDWGWCKDFNDVYSEDCENLGLEDTDRLSFSIYPNPAQNTLFIETQQPIETVKIYNLQGQLVTKVSTDNIDVSSLASGLYFVQVESNGIIVTKKFIKI